MLIHVQFLWNHVDILLASVILVIIIKTIIITMVVKGFGYNNKTSFLVGISLAQIGEFAFVLLSRAFNLHLVEGKLYLLLLGTTTLSLDGDRFWRMRECYIHGNTTEYLRVPDGVVPSVVALVYQVIEQQTELDDLVYIFRLCGFKL